MASVRVDAVGAFLLIIVTALWGLKGNFKVENWKQLIPSNSAKK